MNRLQRSNSCREDVTIVRGLGTMSNWGFNKTADCQLSFANHRGVQRTIFHSKEYGRSVCLESFCWFVLIGNASNGDELIRTSFVF